MITLPPGTKLTAKYSLPDYKIKVGKTYKVSYNGDKPVIFTGGFFDRECIELDNLMQDELKVFGL